MEKKNIVITIVLILAIIGLFVGAYYLISNNGYVSEIDRQISKETESTTATEFTLKDLDGNNISLSEYKGKKIFINIWATWCGPCKKEMPYIDEIYKEYPEIQILMVNSLESKESVQEYIDTYGYSFKVLLDLEEVVTKAYKAYAYPTSILINEDGNIIKRFSGTMTKSQLLKFMQLDNK